MATVLPTTKLVLILRDPLERIWSHAAMYFSRYGQRGLQAATKNEITAFLDQPEVRQRSEYVAILDRWQRFFPAEQLFVGFYEHLQANPTTFFQTICHFLEISPIAPTDVTVRIHSRSYPPLPTWAIEQLMPHYRSDIECLSERFGKEVIKRWLNHPL